MDKKRWGVLAVCCAMMLCMGVLYIWSTLVITLEGQYGWSRMATSGVFTLAICVYCGGNFLGGLLAKRTSVAIRLLLAAVLVTAGFFLAAFFPIPAGVYPGYGVLCSCGIGLAYNTLLGYCVIWFSDRPGLCNGLMLMCYGFSSLLVGWVAAKLIRISEWRYALLILGIVEGAVMLCGALILSRLKPVRSEAGGSESRSRDLSTGEMLRSGRFYLVFLWLVLVTVSGLAATGNASQMALALNMDEEIAALLPGVLSAVGAFGRLGLGRLFDWAGYRVCVLLDSILPAAAMAVLLAAFSLGAPPLLLVGFALVGVSYGGMSSLSPLLTRLFFGDGPNYPKNFSIIAMQMIPASLIGSLLSSSLYVTTGSYQSVCLVLLALEVVGVILAAAMSVGKARQRISK